MPPPSASSSSPMQQQQQQQSSGKTAPSKSQMKREKREEEAKHNPRRIADAALFAAPGDYETPRDVMSEFPPALLRYKDFQIESVVTKLDAGTLKAVFELLSANMRHLYEASNWGWNEKKKMRELKDEEARFLIVRRAGGEGEKGEIAAFAHYRFLVEGSAVVLYNYETQVAAAYQRLGLGKRLILLMEMIARKTEMEWVMLTCLRVNEAAGKFYRQLKYTIDETSPVLDSLYGYDDKGTGSTVDYDILSKPMMPM